MTDSRRTVTWAVLIIHWLTNIPTDFFPQPITEPDFDGSQTPNERLARIANAREMAHYASTFSSPQNIMEIFEEELSALSDKGNEPRLESQASRESSQIAVAGDERTLIDAVLEDMLASPGKGRAAESVVEEPGNTSSNGSYGSKRPTAGRSHSGKS